MCTPLQRGVTTLGVASGVNNLAMMQLMLGEAETNVNAVDEVGAGCGNAGRSMREGKRGM